jgi:hypothetical protein
MAAEVRPILNPTMPAPAPVRVTVWRCWMA